MILATALPGSFRGKDKTFLVACLQPAGEFVAVCSGDFGLAIGLKDCEKCEF
jgi:hypothetical protein